jgi:hypothetical protein
MTMTAFFTHCWTSARAKLPALLAAVLLALCAVAAAQSPAAPEVTQLGLARNGDGVELAAAIRFELPTVVQDALYKGLPVIFVEEVEVYRERWYWFDKRVASAQRQLRLVYQPLTRRWRLSVASGGSSELGALSQTFDALEDALTVIQRVSAWRVADLASLETGAEHRFEFRFRLDTAQLPRPLQIGALGESDWVITAQASRRVKPENLR